MTEPRKLPDGRYDWRDPNMPALVEGFDNTTKKKVMVFVPPETASHLSNLKLRDGAPKWKFDRSYNWRKNNGQKNP